MIYLLVKTDLVFAGEPQNFGPYQFISQELRQDWITLFETGLFQMNSELGAFEKPLRVEAQYSFSRGGQDPVEAPQPEEALRILRRIWIIKHRPPGLIETGKEKR